ncbi:MAG: hypothetical protein ABI301_07375 [Jatrophihabitantaceae bacterium]
MTAVAERRELRWRSPALGSARSRVLAPYLPAIVAGLNAVAFMLVRPDVNDLWAARARASAVQHGVGLTYWFSWFAGGSTPGNYSVITPYVSAFTSAELLGALSAVAIPLLCMLLVRGTSHPIAATSVAAYCAAVNLWSGRVPFLFGAAFALGALLALRQKRTVWTIALCVLSILASPVTGAFAAIGLSGLFLSNREYRRISLITIVSIGLALAVIGVAFGAPGPEPFSTTLKVQVVGALLLLQLARPVIWLRSTIWVSVIATFALAAVPNAMGSNFARIAWYCLPVAVLALSRLRVWIIALMIAPLLVAGTEGTVQDLQHAGLPISQVSYYRPLAAQLDTIQGLENYRVEVVNHGAHAAYDALLNHATLARGWETQEDLALNASLQQNDLDGVTYKVWLDNNAVGYVAMPSAEFVNYPEYKLMRTKIGSMSYLKLVWQTEDWKLYRVQNPTPIVPAPATLVQLNQSRLTLDVPCVCTVNVRVRWSKFLHASQIVSNAGAQVSNDGSGWTSITPSTPGTYVLSGSLSGGLLR